MQFSVKPVFIGWIVLLTQLPIQLFMTVWAGGFFGSFALPLVQKGSHLTFILFGGIAFFGIPIVTYFGKKLNYSRTEYRFYDDRLEFEEGFFTLNKKVIRYKDIRETTLRKGILQRIYGLGSVYLATLATGSSRGPSVFSTLGFGNVSASGITVRDVQTPDEIYDKIRALVDKHN
jgi:uncharacterized membrane protein YdbT with pleckstrin-like domain